MYKIAVESPQFQGQSLVKQHKMVKTVSIFAKDANSAPPAATISSTKGLCHSLPPGTKK
jgi:hypothetical protein